MQGKIALNKFAWKYFLGIQYISKYYTFNIKNYRIKYYEYKIREFTINKCRYFKIKILILFT